MEQNTKSNVSQLKEKILLAKLLFQKYEVMHQFHVEQLKAYPFACCTISVDGEASVIAEEKTIKFVISTKKKFHRKGQTVSKNGLFRNILSTVLVTNSRYNKERYLALKNLTAWCRELFWVDTKVCLEWDGVTYESKQ